MEWVRVEWVRWVSDIREGLAVALCLSCAEVRV